MRQVGHVNVEYKKQRDTEVEQPEPKGWADTERPLIAGCKIFRRIEDNKGVRMVCVRQGEQNDKPVHNH